MSEWNSGSQWFERFWKADVTGTAVDDVVVREFQTVQKQLAYMIWIDGYVTGYGALTAADATAHNLGEGFSRLLRAIATMPIPRNESTAVEAVHFVGRQAAWYRATFLPAMAAVRALVPAELTPKGGS